MNPTLQRLIEIAPPPASPVAPGLPGDWARIESELGVGLPTDFKEYVATYGAGEWADFLRIINPFDDWQPESVKTWRQWTRARFEVYEELREYHPERCAPFSAYPAPNGLLPFGYDDNGGTLCWQVSGDPDSWRIVCLDCILSNQFDSYDMSLTGFLGELLSELLCPRTFPPDFFPVRRPAFRPYTTE